MKTLTFIGYTAKIDGKNYGIEKSGIHSTAGSIGWMKYRLPGLVGHKVSVAELQYDAASERFIRKILPKGCRHIILDDTEGTVTIGPDGFIRGPLGEGYLAALSADCYFTLLGIPRKVNQVSRFFEHEFSRDVGTELEAPYYVKIPAPTKVTYNPTAEVIAKVIQEIKGIVKTTPFDFNEITEKFIESWEDVSLNQALNMLDFHAQLKL